MAFKDINLLTNIYRNYTHKREITSNDLATKVLPDLKNILSGLSSTDTQATVTSDRVTTIEDNYVTKAELDLAKKQANCFASAMAIVL